MHADSVTIGQLTNRQNSTLVSTFVRQKLPKVAMQVVVYAYRALMAEGDVLFEQAVALLLDSEGGESLMKSAALMRRAADSGHAAAANNFGAMLHHGRGVHQDFAAARAYYAQAAEADLPPALFNLGFMKLRGLGGERNETDARRLFEQAAHMGEVNAMTYLGVMMMTGAGGPKEFKTAQSWWDKGAELGDNRCAFNLGIAHAGGHGQDQPDFVEAWRWFSRAQDMGNQSAETELERLASVLTDDERKRIEG